MSQDPEEAEIIPVLRADTVEWEAAHGCPFEVKHCELCGCQLVVVRHAEWCDRRPSL